MVTSLRSSRTYSIYLVNSKKQYRVAGVLQRILQRQVLLVLSFSFIPLLLFFSSFFIFLFVLFTVISCSLSPSFSSSSSSSSSSFVGAGDRFIVGKRVGCTATSVLLVVYDVEGTSGRFPCIPSCDPGVSAHARPGCPTHV